MSVRTVMSRFRGPLEDVNRMINEVSKTCVIRNKEITCIRPGWYQALVECVFINK